MKKVFYTVLISLIFCQNFSFAHGEENHINFIENKGQWENHINYMAKIGGGNVWLHQNKFTFSFINQDDFEKLHQASHGKYKPALNEKIRQHAYTLNFINTNPNVKISSSEKFDFYHNYFIGNDQSKWATNVDVFGEIKYTNLFEGIDMHIKTSDFGYLKYDYVVHPGADASLIKWNYDGIIPLLKNNQIILNSNAGEIIESLPEVYQLINGKKVIVDCKLVLKNKIVSLNFPNGYNSNYELVIDPTVIFSTYTGSTSDNWGYTATYDSQGNAYGGGVVFATGFPVSVGAFDNSFSGGGTVTDIGIIKYNSTGTSRLYATYLGGTGSESPHSLIVDSQDNLVIYGTTSSSNFPTSAGCYDNSFNGGSNVSMDGYISYSAGADIFVTKLNSTGTTLMASTFIGGTGNEGLNNVANLYYNYGDEARGEVIVDANDNIIVASCTQSSNFPTTAGSVSQTYQGTQDGVVFSLDVTLSTLNWSTFLGGTNTDAAYGVKVNPITGNIYVCGGTRSSTGFPSSAGTIHPTYVGGTVDGFIVVVNSSNASLIAGSYFGTASYDQAYAIEIDYDGDVYIMGQSTGGYPISGSVYSNANSSQYIHKMSADLTTTYWSTVFGNGTSGTINISPVAFLVDYCKNIYISGWGGGTNSGYGNGNTNNMPTTAGAYDVTTDGSDFYCMVLERDATSLLYGTFFGGNGQEHVDGGTSRFDNNGTIYQAVCAGCGGSSSFPTTPGVWSNTNQSSNCNLGLFKIEFNYQGIIANANAAPNIIACDPPYDVNFTGSSSGVNHIWDFGDGSPTSTLQDPSHTFTAIGNYTVMYIAIDSSTCNIADTVYLTVEILQAEVFSATLDVGPYDPCTGGPYDVSLEFTGTGADSLIWDMGDGTIYNDTIVNHQYGTDGTYIISMTAYDFTCGLVETITDTVSFNSNNTTANANASPNVIACDPPFIVNYTGGSTPNHYWDFGDGVGTSTLQNPSYTFTALGTYNVMYVGIDSSTCNIADTVYLTVEVLEAEEFSAEFSPIPPQPCSDTVLVAINFTGTGADSLVWNMGDGTIFTNDTAINYAYVVPGSYTMTLTAYDFTCGNVGTISQVIDVADNVIDGNVFVPNVFSPNSDGKNEYFKIGYSNYPSIEAMEYLEVYEVQIYNRWGKLVFEGTIPWNGKMDGTGDDLSEGVYYYILKYQRICLDAEPVTTHGYVTLLRN